MSDFIVHFSETAQINFEFSEGAGVLPYYHGDYEFTPDFDGTVLQTENKSMSSNVTINAIPISRTTNPQGGRTVYIGEVVANA